MITKHVDSFQIKKWTVDSLISSVWETFQMFYIQLILYISLNVKTMTVDTWKKKHCLYKHIYKCYSGGYKEFCSTKHRVKNFITIHSSLTCVSGTFTYFIKVVLEAFVEILHCYVNIQW